MRPSASTESALPALSSQIHNPSGHEAHFTRTLPSLEVSFSLFVHLFFNVHVSVSFITHSRSRSASMTQLSLLVQIICLCLASVSNALPAAEPSLTKRATPAQSTACGDVVNSEGTQFSKVTSVADEFNASDNVVTAKLAYECLTSVPFNAAVATRFMKYFYDSVEFQSNLAYLKNPPASYQQPPVDLLGGLELIQAKINNGAYANQYEFEAALQALIYATHDGHLYLSSGILSLFSFGSQYTIASVSIDGIQLPKVYFSGKVINSIKRSKAKSDSRRSHCKSRIRIYFKSLGNFDNQRAECDRLSHSLLRS